MKRIEFDHRGDRYRIELAEEVLTMSRRHLTSWIEVARLTVDAAGVLAEFDALIQQRPKAAIPITHGWMSPVRRPTAGRVMDRRVAVIGDVGGFAAQLEGCLERVGVHDGYWPPDLHVIQIGDLFGGFDDVAVADIVEPHLLGGRWTQLVGNWELGAVGSFEISRRGRSADPRALDRFAAWSDAGLVHYAAAVQAGSGNWAVITHAGVTSSWWDEHAPQAESAPELANAINTADIVDVHLGGQMCPLGDGDDDEPMPPSPLWASSAELWASWIDRRLPIAQIHGHSGSYAWGHRRWWPDVAPYAGHARADHRHRRVRFDPPDGDHPIWNLDAGLYPAARHWLLHALVVDSAAELVT